RGLRLHTEAGKEDCLVLDIWDRCTRRRLVKASHLFGADVSDSKGGDVMEAARREKARYQLLSLVPSSSLKARLSDWGGDAIGNAADSLTGRSGMKVYRSRRTEHGCTVHVAENGAFRVLNAHLDWRHHSPTGVELESHVNRDRNQVRVHLRRIVTDQCPR